MTLRLTLLFEVLFGSANSAALQQHGVSWVGWGGPRHYVVTPTRVELGCDNKYRDIFTRLSGGADSEYFSSARA
jgi:hypothetical protein